VRRFTNKIVVITGGTSGIGLAAARQFIKEGAKVVVTGRSPRSVSNAQKEIGVDGVGIAADVTKSAQLDALFQQVREKYGRIDVLYVNAGIAKLGSVAETTEDVFDDILDANFRGAYFTVQKALPLLPDGGPSSSQPPGSTRPASRARQPFPPRRLPCVISPER
jgi:NAD(P)-dependent dehydrogenase (short-subunit alcohol dehydrogenase family)